MTWSNPYYPQQSGAVPGQMEMYKQQYQTPQYPMPQANPIAQTAQSMMSTQSPIQWVQGEAAAKAWNVPPNASAVLWDTEAPQRLHLPSGVWFKWLQELVEVVYLMVKEPSAF